MLNGLKQLRDRRLLTQGQVASMSGVSVATLSRIENGRVVPKYKTLRAIAESLRLPVETVREVILSEQSSFV